MNKNFQFIKIDSKYEKYYLIFGLFGSLKLENKL